jgi:hypothetical protein
MSWLTKPQTKTTLLTVFVLAIFFFLRLYRLPSSLMFFNDIGRDLLVVWQSWSQKKPFLLGPQNSALPFNQPALYFYWLYPIAVLSGMSAYTHTVTFLLTIVAILGSLFWIVRKGQTLQLILLSTLWLFAIHPQYIIQNRFIWNPSFVAYFLLLAMFAYFLILKRWDKKWLWLWAFGLSTAIAFSYSVVPTMLAFALLIVWQWRKKSWPFALSLTATSVWWQLPTILFELRYQFQLTKAVLWGERPVQESVTLLEKLNQLLNLFWDGRSDWEIPLLTGFLIVMVTMNWWFIRRTPKPVKLERDQVFSTTSWLTLLTLVLSLIIPIGVQSHYVFGLFTLVFVLVASLRPKLLLITLATMTLWWLQPRFTDIYFRPASRTIAQLEECAALVCERLTEPIFVSLEAGYHPYHNGPEFRFFFSKHGCQVKAIETENHLAQTMAVVVDQGQYEHGRTRFNELTLFGESQEKEVIACPGNIQIHVLER